MVLEVGTEAPDFTLNNQFGEAVTLSSFRGEKNVVVVFYPFAFSGLCTNELCDIRDRKGEFDNDDVVVLGVSCDTKHALKKFAELEGLEFQLLSDFWPHGAVAEQYGVFLPEFGMAKRGTFIIDKQGVLRWSVVNGPGEVRNSDEYREALAALSTPASL